jgi:hypothetical protein
MAKKLKEIEELTSGSHTGGTMKNPKRILSFNRISKGQVFDIEERLRSDSSFEGKDIDLILQLASTGRLIRSPGDLRSLDNVLDAITIPTFSGSSRNFKNIDIDIKNIDIKSLLRAFEKWYFALIRGPYRINIVNKLNEPVQYVWAYERWDGLILIEESTYTAPGATAVLTSVTLPPPTPCYLMKQYAISVWDQNDEEIGRIPTLTVQYINQTEKQKNGFWRICEDTIEIG